MKELSSYNLYFNVCGASKPPLPSCSIPLAFYPLGPSFLKPHRPQRICASPPYRACGCALRLRPSAAPFRLCPYYYAVPFVQPSPTSTSRFVPSRFNLACLSRCAATPTPAYSPPPAPTADALAIIG